MGIDKGSRVLVTGGCGFIGSHIVDQLILEDYEVAVVDNIATGDIRHLQGKRVSFYKVDILDQEFEDVIGNFSPSCIIHQAAQASVAHSFKNIIEDERVNIQGSIRVLEGARKHHVQKVIYASTAAVYGNPFYLPIDEQHPVHPKSPYGISKSTVEHYLRVAQERYGVEYTILRYANVFGPRQNEHGEDGVISIFANQLAMNEPFTIFGDGGQTRDFIYVEDVARANVLALSYGHNQAYNISSGKGTSINDLVQKMNGIVDSNQAPIRKEPRPGDILHSVLCNRASIRDLLWLPQFSFEEGLKRTLEFYRNKISNQDSNTTYFEGLQ